MGELSYLFLLLLEHGPIHVLKLVLHFLVVRFVDVAVEGHYSEQLILLVNYFSLLHYFELKQFSGQELELGIIFRDVVFG